jgi:sugar phosphate isomerase/epimerase
MSTRRSFIRQTTIATSGLLIPGSFRLTKDDLIGLQLYTLRSEIPKDVEGTIAKVAQIGYNSVEVFGYNNGKFFGKTVDELLAIFNKNNLKSPSGHYSVMGFLMKGDQDELKRTVADAAKLGNEFFVIPFLMDNMRKSLDDYKKLAGQLNQIAVEAEKVGLKTAYHNHNFEFKDWGEGRTGYDVLVKETDPAKVSFEIDFYWITRAGMDPIKMIESNAGRIKMWHIKDMADKEQATYDVGGQQFFTEVGTGIIDYKKIFKYKKESGMKYFFVEQDQTKIPVYESITKSFGYIKNNLVG